MSDSSKRNGARDGDATCTCCGAQGPVVSATGAEWDKMCAVCAARMEGWDNGWRSGALLALGRAVENALAAPGCPPVMVRQAFEVALAGKTHEDYMLNLAGGMQLDAEAFEPRKPSRALAAWDNAGEAVRGCVEAGDIRHAAGYAHKLARDLAELAMDASEGARS